MTRLHREAKFDLLLDGLSGNLRNLNNITAQVKRKVSSNKHNFLLPGPETGRSGLLVFNGSFRTFSSCLRVLIGRPSRNIGNAYAEENQEIRQKNV